MAKEAATKKSKKDETLLVEETREERGGEGKTVVVGIRLDSQSRELLTWALVKAAAFADRVVALHVLNSSASAAAPVAKDPRSQPATVVSVAEQLDAMLAVYEGFCNLKQVAFP